MVKIAERTEVTPAFIEYMVRQSALWMEKFEERMERIPTWARDNEINKFAQVYLRHKEIAERVSTAGAGLDYEITRLKKSPFKKIGVNDYDTELVKGEWVIAETRDIVLKSYDGNWDAGVYRICFPGSTFSGAAWEKIHFVPMREPLSCHRTPHHICYGHDEEGETIEYTHPLCMRTKTCWGGLSAPLSIAFDKADIAEALLYLYRFVEIYTPGDRLRAPGPFMKEVW